MIVSGGAKTWFKAADLADLGLPGLPRTKRKVNELARDDRWALRLDNGKPLARPAAGRGGGLEYHVSLLPPQAVNELVRRGLLTPTPAAPELPVAANDGPAGPRDAELWAWFESQPDKVKQEARERLAAVNDFESLVEIGYTNTAAAEQVASLHDVSRATLWNWLAFVRGIAPAHRLPRLAPQRKGGGREAEIDDTLWRMFLSDYLRLGEPTAASCYGRLKPYAAKQKLTLPHLKTLLRKVERDVDPRVVIARRKGSEALRRSLPPQQRTVAGMHAMELVNIDGHKWDVFVRWPDGVVGRPMMVAIQDIYSRKFLAWRIGRTESTELTRLAFADLFKTWGIPNGCLLDNGRAFASKAITGGAKTRFRFKIRPEDPTGLLTSLGVKVHWATPYRGQSKPIERAFRDLCDRGAKHPAFHGAYTGNRPDAKPENYGSKAIEIDVFTAMVAKIMAAHNADENRRTETARGRSFDAAFAESYACNPIGRANEHQLREALLAADQVSTDRTTGTISLYGNRYWTEALHDLAGERVTVRFDPDNLTDPVHVYRLDGTFFATAQILEATGFLDVESAKRRAKQEGELRRTVRRAEELQDLMSAEQLADMLRTEEPEDEPQSPNVIRPVRIAQTAGAAARRAPLIDRLNFEDLAPATEHRAPLRLVE